MKCKICGNKLNSECTYAKYICKNCNTQGHLSKVCNSKIKNQYFMEQNDNTDNSVINAKQFST